MEENREPVPAIVKRNEDHDVSKDYIKLTRTTGVVGGIGLVAALTMLSPLKEFVFTREEGVGLDRRVARVEESVKDLASSIKASDDKTELRLNQLRNELRGEIKESQAQIFLRLSEVSERIIVAMRTNKIETEDKIKELKDSIKSKR